MLDSWAKKKVQILLISTPSIRFDLPACSSRLHYTCFRPSYFQLYDVTWQIFIGFSFWFFIGIPRIFFVLKWGETKSITYFYVHLNRPTFLTRAARSHTTQVITSFCTIFRILLIQFEVVGMILRLQFLTYFIVQII